MALKIDNGETHITQSKLKFHQKSHVPLFVSANTRL